MSETTITVYLNPVDNGVQEMLQNTNAEVTKMSNTINIYGKDMEQVTVPVGAFNKEQDETGKRVRNALSPLRVASRDVWTLAYAFRRLNTTVFGNNEALAQLVNTMIALGSVLRIVAIIETLITDTTMLNGVIKSLGAVYTFLNAQLAANAFWTAMATAGISVAAGLGAWALLSAKVPVTSTKGSYGPGYGVVPADGEYKLHKGEKIVSNSNPDYSQINVYVTAGSIQTKQDVREIFREAGIESVRERRRRGMVK